MLTTQDAYNQIRAYFTQPGADFAYIEDSLGDRRCRYRTDSGRACAFGCLIPDELYKPEFEDAAATFLLDGGGQRTGFGFIDATDLADYFEGIDMRFIDAAQYEHDTAATAHKTLGSFIAELDLLAARHGLEVPDAA